MHGRLGKLKLSLNYYVSVYHSDVRNRANRHHDSSGAVYDKWCDTEWRDMLVRSEQHLCGADQQNT